MSEQNLSPDLSPTGAIPPTDSGRGITRIEDVVVGKIAALAAREVSGVHALGGAGARMVGAFRDSFAGGANVQQGVRVEVGERQAAVDVDIVAEYGVAIHDLAEAIRTNIITAVERMTGLQVTEVNVTVHDVHLEQLDGPEEDAGVQPDQFPRVQ
ncbi:MAG: Asp23/Gls24 family envelope stress response protein [Corynebacterium sp.]|uniref:Asp23/Gls24 family envelope stress response protein n=1 Tax=Corynebacterium sp. TaxID=1720 RepID=UPI0026E04942|nr:Asp23/Gls24 family envelope stress response protein [Corynebacterium sp.]MDO5671174.1 Asp23/Gls24 family envelope stress response protein [Corynebacterium sp.]